MKSDHKKPVVLIVEDEAMIRLDAVDVVTDAGFIALEAANADQALLVLQSRDDIDVLFTDVNMPGSMDGVELSSKVHDLWPQIGVIITSGMVRLSNIDLSPRKILFPKPYQHGYLVASITQLLGATLTY